MKEIIDTILSEDGKLICYKHWREFRDVEREWFNNQGATESLELNIFNIFNKQYAEYDTEHQFRLQIKRG